MIRFKDRVQAGRMLAQKLEKYKDRQDVIVIGLPRGGVPTAFEVAIYLHAPLDVIVSRKIASPAQPEFALGALTQEGEPFFDERLLRMVGVSKEDLQMVVEAERKEAQRRLALYRGNRPPLDLTNKIAILVDDGIATGATMLATILFARASNAKKIVVAIPVSPPDSLEKIKKEADEVVCLDTPSVFWGVGGFYDSFFQTTDQEVIELINKVGAI